MPQSRNRPPRGDNGPGGKGGDEYITAYHNIDFREKPELYRVGVGEQGVLAAEPFKTEIISKWRFRTPEIARESSEIIYQMHKEYLASYLMGDMSGFPGADMARKAIMMGWTRSRRYANHRGGRKWVDGKELPRIQPGEDSRCDEFAESARIFKSKLDVVMSDTVYLGAVEEWNARFGRSPLQLARELKK